jgi:hypothetical protein
VQQRGAVDLARLDADARWRSAVAWTRVQTAKPPKAQTLYRRQAVPGRGQIVRLVRLDASHDRARFPRVHAFVSYGRLIPWAKASAGTRAGTVGATSGHAELTGAVADAAGLCLRHHPAGQPSLARVEKHPGTGHA